jgi:predicted PurR-regulated permease PerM
MDNVEPTTTDRRPQARQIVQFAIQLVALAFLLAWSFQILAPFFNPILWGAILAVSVFPLHSRLVKVFHGRKGLSATIVSLIMMLIFLALAAVIGIKTGSEIGDELSAYKSGALKLPPPTEKVKEWPLIGGQAYKIWNELSKGFETLVEKHPDEAKAIAGKVASLLASTGKGLLIFLLSIIICGFFLAYADESGNFAKQIFNRLINSKTFDMAEISAITIRNVVKGILGVAFIQSILAGIGFVVAGIPYAGVIALLCLILIIIQVGITPITLGTVIYMWSTASTKAALLFTIWMVPIGLLDNVLKPLLMGKGAPVPMLVIFLGSLGGFIFSGFIGLFTGAVILSLAYRLFDVWLKEIQI